MAIALSLLALLLFDFMGLIIKHLSVSYGPAELSAYRNLFGIVPAVIALWSSRGWHQRGRRVIIRQWPLAMTRGLLVTVAQFLFFFSLGWLPFATVATISYSNAFFITALAIPILGERVGAIRWAAVLLGLAGVVIIMAPGRETFTLAAAAPMGAAFLYALVSVTARRMDDDVPSPLINLYSVIAALVGAFGLTLWTGGFSPISSGMDLIWIVAMGGFGGTAVLCLVVSYRMTEQSNLAPFSYFGIPMAFGLGWLFFDEAPWSDLFPGVLLILVGGAMVIWRERRIKAAILANGRDSDK